MSARKKIFQFNLNGELLREWVSTAEASRALKISNSLISMSLLHQQQTAGGFFWEFQPVTERKKAIKDKIKANGDSHIRAAGILDVEIDAVRKMISEGFKQTEIAAKFNVCAVTVGRFIKRNRLPKSRGNSKRAVGQYWTENREGQMILDYCNGDKDERKRVYSELRWKLLAMIDSIMFRYYRNYDLTDREVMKHDLEVHVVTNAFPAFNPVYGKSYSFIGTIIRNWLRDYYDKLTTEKITSVPISFCYPDNPELLDIAESETTNPDEIKERLAVLKRKAKDRITRLLETVKPESKDVQVFNAILDLIEQSDWNQYYSSYFLLSRTRLDSEVLYKRLKKYKLSHLIKRGVNIEIYKTIIGEYEITHGINSFNKKYHKDYIKYALEEINEVDEEATYKIQEPKTREKRAAKEFPETAG